MQQKIGISTSTDALSSGDVARLFEPDALHIPMAFNTVPEVDPEVIYMHNRPASSASRDWPCGIARRAERRSGQTYVVLRDNSMANGPLYYCNLQQMIVNEDKGKANRKKGMHRNCQPRVGIYIRS